MKYKTPTALILLLIVSSCATSPPSRVDNICDIFREKDDWYDAAADASEKWGSPIGSLMATIHQESRFRAKAKPPRKRILWVIPGPRPSSSYGYTQALSGTWGVYQRDAGNYGADRDEFADAIDFVGWYHSVSHRRNGIDKADTYNLYLAYHEGHGGYKRGSYKGKAWLVNVARKVDNLAERYRTQLQSCESEFERSGWWFWPF
ncbi:MAG: hypothetical protein ACI9GW_000196 [Halieaceae bacterium]|jgi:hypothetical protein